MCENNLTWIIGKFTRFVIEITIVVLVHEFWYEDQQADNSDEFNNYFEHDYLKDDLYQCVSVDFYGNWPTHVQRW